MTVKATISYLNKSRVFATPETVIREEPLDVGGVKSLKEVVSIRVKLAPPEGTRQINIVAWEE